MRVTLVHCVLVRTSTALNDLPSESVILLFRIILITMTIKILSFPNFS